MKTKVIKSAVLLLGLMSVSIYQIHSSSGGASTPKTGAPSETTCTSCHNTYSVQTSGTKYDKIKLSIPFTGGGYIPDSTYRVTISYRETNITKYGFQITALNSKNEAAGTFTNINSRVQTFSSTVGSGTRYYAEHTGTGTSAVSGDSVAWTFEWKAPNSNVGDVKFYLALNVTNSSSGVTGDYIYNKTFTVSPSTLLPKAKAILQSQPCSGVNLNFSADSSVNGNSYTWRFLGGATPSLSTSKNPSVTYSSTGAKSAILEVSNSKGKSKPDTLTFTVVTGATAPSLNVSNSIPLCKGDTAKLSVTPTSNHGYVWSTGQTGNQISVDTAGVYYVTAIRTNGCERKSSDINVLVIPKPSFNVLYGFSGDTICAAEPLLLFTQNKNGFADSYSTSSKTGPYVTDSLLVVNIGKLNKTIQVWSKSKNGCVQGPISKSFFGIDTVSGPSVSVKTKYLDRITFTWSKIPFATEYRYSIDSGKTWNSPIEGKLSDSTSIDLKSVTQKVDFWIQARTSKYCGITQISKISSGGVGCNDIVLRTQISKDSICFDESTKITVSGLPNHSKWAIRFDGKLYKDSIFTITSSKTQNWIFSAIDSTQIACGFYDKQVRIVADSVEEPNLVINPQNNEIICGGLAQMEVSLNNPSPTNNRNLRIKLKNLDTIIDTYPYKLIINGSSDSIVYWYESSSIRGCKSKDQSYRLLFRDSISTHFAVKWLNNFNYSIVKSLKNDNDSLTFKLIKDNQTIYTSNSDSFIYDFQNEANSPIKVVLIVKNAPCLDSSIYEFNSNNLRTQVFQNYSFTLSPNPISNLEDLNVNNIKNQDVAFARILSIDGKELVQKVKINASGKLEFKNSNSSNLNSDLQDGFYLVEILDSKYNRIKTEKIQKIGR